MSTTPANARALTGNSRPNQHAQSEQELADSKRLAGQAIRSEAAARASAERQLAHAQRDLKELTAKLRTL